MGDGKTTHVVEIEVGIGEPAFIPLCLGQEQQPISVGKKGMWKVESQRVLDVHAFVYFDGSTLFLQSADDEASAIVDGHEVGKTWTELHAPCKIELGAARLRYRSLAAGAEDGKPTAAQMKPLSPPNRATRPPQGAEGARGAGPVIRATMPPGRSTRPAPSDDGSGAPTRPMPPLQRPQTIPPGQRPPTMRPPVSGGAPPAASSSPVILPKPERPFRAGEFASESDESTRVAPLDTTSASRARSGMSGLHRPPAAGRPADLDILPPRGEPVRALPNGEMQGGAQGVAHHSHPPMGGGGGGGSMPPPAAMNGQGPMMHGGNAGGHGAMGMAPSPAPSNPPPQAGYPQQGYGNANMSGPYAAMAPGAMPPMGGVPHGTFGPSMGPNMPSMGPGMAPGMGPGMGQPVGPNMPSMGPGMGPGVGPGMGQSVGPNMPSMGPGMGQPAPGMPSVPSGFGSMTPQGGMQSPPPQSGGLPEMLAKWKTLSIPKRILLVIAPFSFASAIYMLLEEDPPPRPTKAVATLDGGVAPTEKAAVAAGSSLPAAQPSAPLTPPAAATPSPQDWPPGVPCPPPNWPANRPLPCVPNGLSAGTTPPVAGTEPPVTDPKTKDARHRKDKDAKDSKDAGAKTLERLAVESLAGGDYTRAAEKYEELSRQDPTNAAYAEAARIARLRKDAGAP